jgi:hypothetical protein
MNVGRVRAKDVDKDENGRVSYKFKDPQRLLLSLLIWLYTTSFKENL